MTVVVYLRFLVFVSSCYSWGDNVSSFITMDIMTEINVTHPFLGLANIYIYFVYNEVED
jgi:hypothetical protein